MKIDKDENDSRLFYSPFGPKFLHIKLIDDIKLKLLDCVNQLRQSSNKPEQTIVQSEQDVKSGDTQSNTIVDGEMCFIDRKHQVKYGNIVANTITTLIELYAKKYYEDQEKNTGYHQPMEKFEYVPLDCWYVVMKSGDFLLSHDHRPVGINRLVQERLSFGQVSGAIYLDVPENLMFPQGFIEWSLSSRKEPLSSFKNTYNPQSGHALVWPSWLEHSVYPFKGKEERIMISFNGLWREPGCTEKIKYDTR